MNDAGPGDLVIYDTAAGLEISRTAQVPGVGENGGDHYPAGNRFLQVSANSVVWAGGDTTYSYDGARAKAELFASSPFLDVHDDIVAVGDDRGIALKVPGQADQRYPDLEAHFRLSPTGNYLLAVEGTETRHAATIVDTKSGDLWPVPKDEYPWIAWSYGDIAMVETEDALLACVAARQECATLHPQRPFLMPTN